MSENGIIWLSSYPKSGNTWLRLLLGNYFFAANDKPLGINDIKNVIRGDVSRSLYRDLCAEKGWNLAAAMNDLEKRSAFLTRYVQGRGTCFLKSHSCVHKRKTISYFAGEYTRGFIYVVRDPRDVLCSYARHFRLEPEEAFEQMANENTVAGGEDEKREFISSWDNNVNSYIGTAFPTIIIRYEDLHEEPGKILSNIVRTLGHAPDEEKLEFAVEQSSFDTLRKQEEQQGFVESPYEGHKFFNFGRSGGWHEALAPDIVESLEQRFGETMKRFSYL